MHITYTNIIENNIPGVNKTKDYSFSNNNSNRSGLCEYCYKQETI